MGSARFCIDLFDDEIESLRTFDLESQRTLETLDALRLLRRNSPSMRRR